MEKEDIYAIGYPAKDAYNLFIKFVLKYAEKNDKVLDVGGGEGAYSYDLKKRGYNSICVDIDEKYIKRSKEKGVESYVMDGCNLDFPDNSFDIILLFEVLEHTKNFEDILKEAKRVASKYILITLPNCGGLEKLRPYLTYDHFLATDHVNFFTKKDFEYVLSKHFESFKINETEPIIRMIGLPIWMNYIARGLVKLNLIKSGEIYYRLCAVIEVQ